MSLTHSPPPIAITTESLTNQYNRQIKLDIDRSLWECKDGELHSTPSRAHARTHTHTHTHARTHTHTQTHTRTRLFLDCFLLQKQNDCGCASDCHASSTRSLQSTQTYTTTRCRYTFAMKKMGQRVRAVLNHNKAHFSFFFFFFLFLFLFLSLFLSLFLLRGRVHLCFPIFTVPPPCIVWLLCACNENTQRAFTMSWLCHCWNSTTTTSPSTSWPVFAVAT